MLSHQTSDVSATPTDDAGRAVLREPGRPSPSSRGGAHGPSGQASALFAQPRSEGLQATPGSIEQTCSANRSIARARRKRRTCCTWSSRSGGGRGMRAAAPLLSPVVDPLSLRRMGIELERPPNVGAFSKGQRWFLEYHRENVLRMVRR